MLAIQKIVDHAGGCGAHVLKCREVAHPPTLNRKRFFHR
jgi:hypothetical protein